MTSSTGMVAAPKTSMPAGGVRALPAAADDEAGAL